jgi:hypothetical protein
LKTLEQILSQDPVYLNDWSARIDVIGDFEEIHLNQEEYETNKCPYPNEEYWEGINILFASYGCANYSGDAWVLFEQDGKLYEVNGSHCSCYGA